MSAATATATAPAEIDWLHVRNVVRFRLRRRVISGDIPESDLDDVTQEITAAIWYAVEIDDRPLALMIWRHTRRKAVMRALLSLEPGEQCDTPERWEEPDYAGSEHYVRKYGLYDVQE